MGSFTALSSGVTSILTDNLIAVGERLIGPFNIEAVVEPIDIKISDAIMNFQNSGYDVNVWNNIFVILLEFYLLLDSGGTY